MPQYLITNTEKLYYEGADGNQLTGDENYGNYQFIAISNVVNDFIATYCTEGKILEGTKKGDVNYHAMRAMQELSYDTFNSTKSIAFCARSSFSLAEYPMISKGNFMFPLTVLHGYKPAA